MNNFENYLNHVFDYLPQGKTVEAMYYSLLNPGKRVRSQLFFELLKDLEINEKYYEIGAAIEMIHTYSLIHDDLPAMDNATMRRNLPCSHIQFNEAIAILAGDGLLTESFYQLSKLNIDPNKKIHIIQQFVNASGCNGMIYGQELDILNENNDISQEELQKIHYNKTGAMIVLPIKIALILADKEEHIERFSKAMQLYGLSFQVKDDLLDQEDKNLIGKDSSDKDLNKSTYLKILGYESSLKLYYELIDACFNIINEIGEFPNLRNYMQSLIERNN